MFYIFGLLGLSVSSGLLFFFFLLSENNRGTAV